MVMGFWECGLGRRGSSIIGFLDSVLVVSGGIGAAMFGVVVWGGVR